MAGGLETNGYVETPTVGGRRTFAIVFPLNSEKTLDEEAVKKAKSNLDLIVFASCVSA